jgi:hypothetical protein
MMAKQNKTSKIKRNNKTKTNKLKRGGSTSGLLRTTTQGMKPNSYILSSGHKPSSEDLEKSIEKAIEAIENVQKQNISPGEQNAIIEKITEQLKNSLRQEQRSNGNNYETKNAELNATKSENNKPKNTQNSDPTNFKMTLPPNHSWGKTLGFGLGVGIITGSVILATSH